MRIAPLALALLATASYAQEVPLLRTPYASSGYSVYFPVVTRVQGASTIFYTSLDITNNHSTQATDVFFSYLSADLTVGRNGKLVTLQKLGSYHSDDILQTFADMGILTQAQANSTFGTLFLTFTNATFTTGTEASAVARVYNYVSGNSGPSIGLAYRAQLLRTNGAHRLVSVLSDTDTPGATRPRVVTNMGLMNVGVNDAGDAVNGPATLTLTFIDPLTGGRVGTQPTITLNAAQVLQINDLFSQYSIPSNVTSLTVLVEGPTGASAPQIDGYVVLKDTSTNDGSYFPMQTASNVTTAPSPVGPPPPAARWYFAPLLDFKLHPDAKPTAGHYQLCFGPLTWSTTLQGDLAGTSYKFSLGLGRCKDPGGCVSYTAIGEGHVAADIVLKRGSNETLLATSNFTATGAYQVQTASVTGIDPDAQAGDTLLLRVRTLDGQPCVSEPVGNGTDHFIETPGPVP
ncbi:MAG TPA: hypothetical protein VJZ00_25830 [Thermoanaerobaculia bacterium]|nr:hypothetical protein [Thermoanaerobaculia bacterium]